ncbi:hypothetical protein [Meiothermus taiwanensis]|jgi:hypothetical protein|uniref:Uncharacterized protein n=2 Tax=Meiothermus taiwanensis TaxID=172827 RepID=A0A399DVF8_9DEIN|nr:hypothetical protein [Meiothermus taiwanensis]AWR88102.1 hypothetical protein Mtai_v1c28810 [Meiothermus taiwanensis WR-220]KIQ53843.1 hypothetical protein SY28_11765 [Meiothermus taiwanensis]KZK14692.1 hypothetical protein A3962_13035 [Meiothermus taiwanensis]RIH75158.1 hypothetical protein Mcate_02364 [Meiothermus taiwanensis]
MKHLKQAWLAASVLCGIAVAQVELRPNQQYQGGTQVRSSTLGIGFALPRGWLGVYKEEGEQAVLVLGSNSVEGVGLVIFMKNQPPARVVEVLNEAQDLGNNVVLQLVGSVRTQGSRVTARYLNDLYVGRALALLGSRNHVIYFYVGPQKNEALYAQLLEGLAGSTRFQAPVAARPQLAPPVPDGAARQWTQFLAGSMLKYFSSYNSGGSSGGISEERTLHLCSDGSFAYLDQSLTTLNVPGASASSGGRGRAVGRWRIESATQNSAVLLLNVDGGGVERVRIEYDGERTFLNGERWFRVRSDACP